MNETKKWYEIVQILGIDLAPIIWFVLTAVFIFTGWWLIYAGVKESDQGMAAIGTLFASLGGAGIARIRSSKPQEPEKV